MKRKNFYYLGAFTFLVLIGLTGYKVFAENYEESRPMIININPSGEVLLRGYIKGNPTNNSVVIKSWGPEWIISILPTTKISTISNNINDLKDGDFVGVSGKISSDGTYKIDAQIIREWAKKIDYDKDGISDDQDDDNDNDGIKNHSDAKPLNHDNDDKNDDLDDDDDNDGIEDIKDSKKYDHDNDGLDDSDDDKDDLEDDHGNDKDNHDND